MEIPVGEWLARIRKTYKPDLSSQLTFEDIDRLNKPLSLTDKQWSIVNLLSCDCTGSMIADRLKCSRAYVSQTINFLSSENLIKKTLNQKYNAIYELSPTLKNLINTEHKGQVTSCRVHAIGLSFRILKQSGPLSMSEKTGYEKQWPMRGGIRYAYWYPRKAGEVNITVHVHPRSLVIRMDKGQKIIAKDVEEAELRGFQFILNAKQRFVDLQRRHGVEIEAEPTGKLVGKVEYGFSVPKYLAPSETTALKGWKIDKSVQELGQPGRLELETKDKSQATQLDHLILTAQQNDDRINSIEATIPDALKDINKNFNPLQKEIEAVKAILMSGRPAEAMLDQAVGLMAEMLSRINKLESKLEKQGKGSADAQNQ